MKEKFTVALGALLSVGIFFMLSTKVNNAEVPENVSYTSSLEEFASMRSSIMVNEKVELSFSGNQLEFDLEDCTECGIDEIEEVIVTTTTTTSPVTTTKKPTTTPKPSTTKTQTTTTSTTTSPVVTTAPSTTTTPVTTTAPSTGIEGTTSLTTTTVAPSPSPVTDMAKQIFEIVNQKREAAGKKAYVLDEKLCEIANMRAKELVTKFSHTRPNGLKYDSALKEQEYTYSAVGENIAYGYSSASAVMNKWMSSAPHKANILDSNGVGYTKIGIGYYNNNGTKYYVQLFVK